MTPALMRDFIDPQAEHPAETVLGWCGLPIGGNIKEMKVTAEGVETTVVREWSSHAERDDDD
jgi:hypothetical protein